MSSQDLMIGSRLARVREIKDELARVREENARLKDELASIKAHFDLALLAADDLRGDAPLEIWDGWNLLLGATREAHDKADLLDQAAARAAEGVKVWVVFDGPKENVSVKDGVRVSWTGGMGEHRADKFACDFVRMARYLGLADRVSVRTNDKDFAARVRRLKGGPRSVAAEGR